MDKLQFSSLPELQKYITDKEKREFIKLIISDCRTINAYLRMCRVKRYLNETLKYYHIKYRCVLSHFHKKKSKGKRRNRGTNEQQCPFVMSFRISTDGRTLDLVSSVNEHNHDCIKETLDEAKITGKEEEVERTKLTETDVTGSEVAGKKSPILHSDSREDFGLISLEREAADGLNDNYTTTDSSLREEPRTSCSVEGYSGNAFDKENLLKHNLTMNKDDEEKKKRIKLDLELEHLKLQNYKLKLETLEIELKLGLERSKHTIGIPPLSYMEEI